MPGDGVWSVGEVAHLAGVSVRTLHHYDRIGLVRVLGRSGTGYREYDVGDVARLQRVLAYRELGLPLRLIGRLLDDPQEDVVARLSDHRAGVEARIERLRRIATEVERTMEAHDMGIRLTAGEMLEVFGTDDLARHAGEVRERWGDTDAHAQSRQRTARYGKQDWVRIRAAQEAVETRLAQAMSAGLPADSPEAMDAAQAHRDHIDRWFYDLPADMHVLLGEMYVQDERFTQHYERRAPGLARYVRDAIVANAAR